MKKLFELVLVAVVFFSFGIYMGQENSTSIVKAVDKESTTSTMTTKTAEKKAKPHVVKSKNLAVVYTFDKDIEAQYNALTEKKVQTIGFALTDPHKRVNDHYKEKYGSTKLDFLSFQSIVNDEKIKKLLTIDPRIAAFSPFNLLGYKQLNEKQTLVMHLVPEAILDIIGITDEKLRAEYIDSFVELDALIEKELGGKKSYIEYDKLAEKRMMNFELTFDRPKDLTDFVDDFQESFEETFEEGGYLIAGYYNFKENGKDTIPEYDAFWTYALCHFKYSYTVFDNEGGRPKAGIYAPCAMYMYVKKDTNILVIGMPTLANWGATLKIEDPLRAEFIKKLDSEIPELLVSLGAKVVPNKNPLTKSTASTKAVKEVASTSTAKVAEEKKVKVEATPRVVTTPSSAGSIDKNDFISAYLRGPHTTTEQVEADLTNAGFEVLGVHSVDKKNDLTTVVFTSPSLKEMANKKDRGFMGVLKVLIDDENKQISISNPLYFAKAYMQDDFDKTMATKILTKLNQTFEGLKNAKDGMEFNDLSGYHFAMSMPYYEDMESVARGTNAELLAKAKASGSVVFELTLNNGSTLLGVALDKRTTKFAKKIGANNASIIPYTVLIEDDKVKVLAPKYNLALHYPLLSMTGFMTIATVPGAILKDCKKVFQ